MIIVITGIIGSGKTTAAGFFKEAGFHMTEVDKIGHRLLQQPDVKQELIDSFGKGILGTDGYVDRTRLGDTVFGDKEHLQELNRIVHPLILKEIKSHLTKTTKDVVIDTALWEELQMHGLADKVIQLRSDPRNSYIRHRNRYSKEKIDNIMKCQSQISNPDHIIENNGTIEELRNKVLGLCKEL